MFTDITWQDYLITRDREALLLEAIRRCDLMIVGGTSLVVQPAAGMIMYRRPSCKLVLINRDETPYDDQADLVIHEDLGTVLDAVIPGC